MGWAAAPSPPFSFNTFSVTSSSYTLLSSSELLPGRALNAVCHLVMLAASIVFRGGVFARGASRRTDHFIFWPSVRWARAPEALQGYITLVNLLFFFVSSGTVWALDSVTFSGMVFYGVG